MRYDIKQDYDTGNYWVVDTRNRDARLWGEEFLTRGEALARAKELDRGVRRHKPVPSRAKREHPSNYKQAPVNDGLSAEQKFLRAVFGNPRSDNDRPS